MKPIKRLNNSDNADGFTILGVDKKVMYRKTLHAIKVSLEGQTEVFPTSMLSSLFLSCASYLVPDNINYQRQGRLTESQSCAGQIRHTSLCVGL